MDIGTVLAEKTKSLLLEDQEEYLEMKEALLDPCLKISYMNWMDFLDKLRSDHNITIFKKYAFNSDIPLYDENRRIIGIDVEGKLRIVFVDQSIKIPYVHDVSRIYLATHMNTKSCKNGIFISYMIIDIRNNSTEEYMKYKIISFIPFEKEEKFMSIVGPWNSSMFIECEKPENEYFIPSKDDMNSLLARFENHRFNPISDNDKIRILSFAPTKIKKLLYDNNALTYQGLLNEINYNVTHTIDKNTMLKNLRLSTFVHTLNPAVLNMKENTTTEEDE